MRTYGRASVAILFLVGACGDSTPAPSPDMTSAAVDGAVDAAGDAASGMDGPAAGDGPATGDGPAGVDIATTGDIGPTVDLPAVDMPTVDMVPTVDLMPAGDLMPSCGAEGAACMTETASAGLCNATTGVCSACTDVTDDAKCNTAYGSSNNPYLCLGGVCAPGNCRTDADCPAGQLCGATTPNLCGNCSSDSACQASSRYGSTFICGATGTCVSGACTTASTACTQQPSDVCCNAACVPGSCCVNADCASKGNTFVCANHVCTQCMPVSGTTYLVDPINGSDQTGTGSSNPQPSCAFKTVTRALQVIGSPLAATTIQIVAPTAGVTVGAGETFPIAVPANVTITSSGGIVTVAVPSGKTGFLLHAASSAITNLVIDGTANVGLYGIVVAKGADTTTSLSGDTVQSFAHDGILVAGGAVSLGAGMTVTKNGTSASRHSGLHVTTGGSAVVNVPSGQAASTFNANTAHGILVDGTGSVTITGAPGTGSNGTVQTSSNYFAGVWIQQTPGSNAPACSITGLVAWGQTAGNGIRILAGSSVKLRSSVALANKGNGVLVSTGNLGATPVNDVSKIDLGSGTDWGHNTLQAAVGQNPNFGAGVCLQLTAGAAQTLAARGNVFRAIDCSTTNPGALTKNGTCSAGVDVGITSKTNDIDVTNCTK